MLILATCPIECLKCRQHLLTPNIKKSFFKENGYKSSIPIQRLYAAIGHSDEQEPTSTKKSCVELFYEYLSSSTTKLLTCLDPKTCSQQPTFPRIIYYYKALWWMNSLVQP